MEIDSVDSTELLENPKKNPVLKYYLQFCPSNHACYPWGSPVAPIFEKKIFVTNWTGAYPEIGYVNFNGANIDL